MNWPQVLTLIGCNVALIGALISVVRYMLNKIDGDMKTFSNRMDGHATRIDQLYSIIVSLLQKK